MIYQVEVELSLLQILFDIIYRIGHCSLIRKVLFFSLHTHTDANAHEEYFKIEILFLEILWIFHHDLFLRLFLS